MEIHSIKMKNTINSSRRFFALLFVIGLFSIAGFSQSSNPDSPTVLKQNSIQWKRKTPSKKDLVYYYSFTAGPGTVEITTDQKSVGITGNENLSWDLTSTRFSSFGSEMFFGVTNSERKVNEVMVDKKQKVILKITVTEDVQEFKINFDGAVEFEGNEEIPEITGTTEMNSTQQICMPRNGVIVLTMQDGKKAKVDLSKVQKIEIQ